jgi:hypothetical protein
MLQVAGGGYAELLRRPIWRSSSQNLPSETQGEILGLMWEDIDMEAGILHVRRTLSTAMGEGFSFNAPKTSKSRRSIRIP